MTLTSVQSEAIKAIGYDPALKELHVKFKSGTVHAYSGVSPESHAALMRAKSIGGHFAKRVRPHYKSRELK